MVVSVVVNNGQQGTETIEALVEETTDRRTGEQLKLQNPFRITLRKSESLLIYDINYIQRVNSKPAEEIIYKNIFTCEDGAASQKPTCGWYVNELGKVVAHSQGYCCSCSIGQIVGISNDGSRAALDCKLFGSNGASAHCLRFNDLWYDVFAVGTALTYYEIQVVVEMTRNSQPATETIIVSAEQPIQTTSDQQIIARLIGDFAAFKQAPVFVEKYLMVPSQPLSHPRVQQGIKNWMLVDKVDVALDGTVCNKIGVSFEAFRTEFGACQNQPGSCLRNQLEDFFIKDEAKRNTGRVGDYLLEFYGDFSILADQENNRFLAMNVTQIQNSLVTLTFAADDIRFITNRSPGVIDEAAIEDFEAGSKNGILYAIVRNTGSIVSDYSLTVTNCSQNILPIAAQQFSLTPSVRRTLKFEVYTSYELRAENVCTVSLYDSIGGLQDQVIVNFTTTPTIHHEGAQGGNRPEEGGELLDGLPKEFLGCNDFCPNFYDVLCFIFEGCWKQLLLLFGVIIGVGLFLLCCCYCILSGNALKIVKCCCSVAKAGSRAQGELIDETRMMHQKAFRKPKRKRHYYSDSDSDSD